MHGTFPRQQKQNPLLCSMALWKSLHDKQPWQLPKQPFAQRDFRFYTKFRLAYSFHVLPTLQAAPQWGLFGKTKRDEIRYASFLVLCGVLDRKGVSTQCNTSQKIQNKKYATKHEHPPVFHCHYAIVCLSLKRSRDVKHTVWRTLLVYAHCIT